MDIHGQDTGSQEADFEGEVSCVTDRIRALRAEGLTPAQIRERLPGVSRWAVNCVINRGADARAAHPGLRARAKDADRERARQLRRQGKTYREIRAEIAVSNSTLSMWLRDLPYPEPGRASHAAHMHEARRTMCTERRTATKAAAFVEIGHVSDRNCFCWALASTGPKVQRTSFTIGVRT